MQPADPGRATSASKGGLSYDAANDDQGPVSQIARTQPEQAAAGWDPFEVWRTRVRDPRRAEANATA